MGTNCTSQLPDFYFAMYELSFICTWLHCTWMLLLVSCAQSFYRIACAFLLTARYIDEWASICSPHIHHLLCADQYIHLIRITGIPQDFGGHAC